MKCTNERNKGRRLEGILNDFVVFDLETTGTNIYQDEIVEIAAIKIVNNEVVDTFAELVKPTISIPFFASRIHGITDDMVCGARTLEPVLKKFLEFIGDFVLVGHNITSFDLNLIYDASIRLFDIEVKNDFLDTLYMSRKCVTDIENHKLSTLCEVFHIDVSNAHRALADCHMTLAIYRELPYYSNECAAVQINRKQFSASKRQYAHQYTDETRALQTLQGFLLGITSDNILTDCEILAISDWMSDNVSLRGNYPFDKAFAALERVLEDSIIEECEKERLLSLFKELTEPIAYMNPANHIVFERKNFCLTGNFEVGTKCDVEKIITDKQGIVSATIKKHSDYLIVGGAGSPNWKCGNYGGKIKKALEMQTDGNSIIILSEEDFLKLIQE